MDHHICHRLNKPELLEWYFSGSTWEFRFFLPPKEVVSDWCKFRFWKHTCAGVQVLKPIYVRNSQGFPYVLWQSCCCQLSIYTCYGQWLPNTCTSELTQLYHSAMLKGRQVDVLHFCHITCEILQSQDLWISIQSIFKFTVVQLCWELSISLYNHCCLATPSQHFWFIVLRLSIIPERIIVVWNSL